MSYGRKVKGVHQLFTDAQSAGERFLTCACGAQWHSPDPDTAFSLFWQHTQNPAHR